MIVADIDMRNLLVAKDLSVKFCDFAESSFMELGCDMYEVITGRKCDFDLF